MCGVHTGDRGRRWRDAVAAAADSDARGGLLDVAATEAAGGDLDALDDLLWAVDTFGLARRAIRRLVLDESDADEVEQDVLVAVAESVHGFRAEARFTTWLYAIARRKAIDALRRRRIPTIQLSDEVGDAARISSLIATRAVLHTAIAALPERYRAAVVLRDVEGREYAEVAQRLGLNLNTARTRIARGRALVAAQLRGER
jgi:RNA polymerase sigma-70 factor, ECF subfamily